MLLSLLLADLKAVQVCKCCSVAPCRALTSTTCAAERSFVTRAASRPNATPAAAAGCQRAWLDNHLSLVTTNAADR
jgi:hypothetical protein